MNTKESWETEFTQKFPTLIMGKDVDHKLCDHDKIIDHLRVLIADEREAAVAEYQLKMMGK